MKRKLFLGFGGAILFVAGAFAGKNHSKFAPLGIYYSTGTFCNKLEGCAPLSGTLVTYAPAGATSVAFLVTKLGGKLKVYLTSACHNVSYMIP
jgi:hypothetical protein